MKNQEKLHAYHLNLAQSFRELVKRRKLERNEKKIARVSAELKRTGRALKEIRERDSFDSENPDRGMAHPHYEH